MQKTAAPRGFFKRLTEKPARAVEEHPVIATAALAFIETLVIEMASRHSLIRGFVFLFTHPLNFAAGMFIVLSTLSLAHLFKKRSFWLILFSGFWLLCGFINAGMLFFRVTPFSPTDLTLIPSATAIFTIYLEVWHIVLLAVGLIALVTGLVLAYIHAAKHPVRLRMASVLIAGSVLLAVGSYSLTVVGHEESRERPSPTSPTPTPATASSTASPPAPLTGA